MKEHLSLVEQVFNIIFKQPIKVRLAETNQPDDTIIIGPLSIRSEHNPNNNVHVYVVEAGVRVSGVEDEPDSVDYEQIGEPVNKIEEALVIAAKTFCETAMENALNHIAVAQQTKEDMDKNCPF